MQCTRCHSPKISNYAINSHFLELKPQHSYLGLTINGTMQWSPNINNIATKTSKALNFIRRNLNNCSAPTKARAYLSFYIVYLTMDYASCVWDPTRLYISVLLKRCNDKLLDRCCPIMEGRVA